MMPGCASATSRERACSDQIGVCEGHGLQQALALLALNGARGREQVLQPLPALGVHPVTPCEEIAASGPAPASSLCSHARAKVQSRLTVAADVFSASAVSSRLRPPKNGIPPPAPVARPGVPACEGLAERDQIVERLLGCGIRLVDRRTGARAPRLAAPLRTA